MRVFTLKEANELLPAVRRKLLRLQKIQIYLSKHRAAAQNAAENAVKGGGGMVEGGIYVTHLLEFGEITGNLEKLGVQLKDIERGLIDFPAWREDRIVLLCWQLGDGEQIEWWHDIEAGFAGRQPL